MIKNLTAIARNKENPLVIFILAAISLLVFACGGSGGEGGGGAETDTVPPDPITDIAAVPGTRATISWTAPGDDGNVGSAASYDVRISESPINSENDFENATLVVSPPSPLPAGTQQQLTIPGLDVNKTYYVAMKTSDSSGNVSVLSAPFSFSIALNEISFGGAKSASYLGHSVSNAGDIDGDGISDIIAGARNENNGTGSVYIFLGGSNINDAQVILEGQRVGEEFGYSVAGAGDINKDGCHDIIIGTNENSGNLNKKGRVYIYYGSGRQGCPGPLTSNSQPDIIIEGIDPNNFFGWSVASAGDVDQDGYSDVLIGAPGPNVLGSADPGHAYIFYGINLTNAGPGAVLSASNADITMTGTKAGDRFGYSVSGGMDVNGDQVDDIFVGAIIPSGMVRFGAAYFFSGADLVSNPDRIASGAEYIITGVASNDQLGWSLTMLNDVNGDGLADLAVGTPIPTQGQADEAGAVYIFNQVGLDLQNGITDKRATEADVTLNGDVAEDHFGWSVADGGDINVDGFSDIIIGAPSSGQNPGRAMVFYGGPGLAGTINASSADVVLIGENSTDTFGNSVAGIGDTNGDGYDEIVVGAPFSDNDFKFDNGAVYIYR